MNIKGHQFLHPSTSKHLKITLSLDECYLLAVKFILGLTLGLGVKGGVSRFQSRILTREIEACSPAPGGLVKDIWGEAESSHLTGEEGTDWPTRTACQRKLQWVSFPPFQLWTSIRSFISLLL